MSDNATLCCGGCKACNDWCTRSIHYIDFECISRIYRNTVTFTVSTSKVNWYLRNLITTPSCLKEIQQLSTTLLEFYQWHSSMGWGIWRLLAHNILKMPPHTHTHARAPQSLSVKISGCIIICLGIWTWMSWSLLLDFLDATIFHMMLLYVVWPVSCI